MIDPRQLVMLAFLVLACGTVALAGPSRTPRTLKVLTIGNSFSGNATTYLDELAAAAGHRLILARADIGGCSMEKHWSLAVVADTKPDDPSGKPYRIAGSDEHFSLKEMLTHEKWDIVTIQQYSVLSHDPSTYRPYARNLRDYAREYAPQAEVVIHQTWAYRRDDPRFESGTDSQERMYQQLTSAYHDIASELGLRIIPVGDAFHAADTFDAWRYRPVDFDRAALRYPDLPDQTHSLHAGYYWATGENGSHKLAMDGHHAGASGCYLAGCVWFESLFGESVEHNPFVPKQITQEDARVLRYIAHRAVQEHPGG